MTLLKVRAARHQNQQARVFFQTGFFRYRGYFAAAAAAVAQEVSSSQIVSQQLLQFNGMGSEKVFQKVFFENSSL